MHVDIKLLEALCFDRISLPWDITRADPQEKTLTLFLSNISHWSSFYIFQPLTAFKKS